MGNYYLIKPEVSGGYGDETEFDRTVERVEVTRLHYEVADWLGDCVVTISPVYLIVPDTAAKLNDAGYGRFRLDDALVTPSDIFEDINPGGQLPELKWLVVDGKAGVDHVGLNDNRDLVVSEAVLDVFRADGFTVGTAIPWNGV